MPGTWRVHVEYSDGRQVLQTAFAATDEETIDARSPLVKLDSLFREKVREIAHDAGIGQDERRFT